jgi:hypothetical protein
MRNPLLPATFLLLILGLPLAFAASTDLVLVTPEEFAEDQLARAKPGDDGRTAGAVFDAQVWTRSLDAPLIEVLSPDINQVLQAPIDIDIRFTATPGSMIALHTVRVRYGVIGLDITERLRNVGAVTKEGIRARGALLPLGEHPMVVDVEDTNGNRTQHRFTLRIVE